MLAQRNSDIIENIAKREEDKLPSTGIEWEKVKTVGDSIAVNDLYVESIKAKLSILDQQ